MKKYILIITSFILFIGCDIDLKPESSLTYNGFWDTEEAVRSAHVGIYSTIRNYNYTLWRMGELRSDIWGGPTLESPSDLNLIDNNINVSNAPFTDWAQFYKLMHYINDFIKNAPKVTFKNENEKNHLLGQVYGIRAYIYFSMLKAWGDIPITTEPINGVDILALQKPRSPKTEVMTQIKSDLEQSLDYFGNDNNLWLNTKIYWSKAATLTLKGEAYLWSGVVLGSGETDFLQAKIALESISGFSLVPYTNLWGADNESNNEFIFTIDYQRGQASNFYSNFTSRAVDIHNETTGGLWDANGTTLIDFVVNGGNRYGPSEKILSLIDDTNDARRGNFIRIYTNNAGHIPFDNNGYVGAILTKFLGNVGSDGLRENYNNIPIYRYADVLLLLAEAKNHLNEDPSAEINAVRQRAYGANFPGYQFTNGSKTENTNHILNERLKEFIGEGKRWWDLVRAGGNYVYDEIPTLKRI